MGLCLANSPLPGLIWQEILTISSLIFVHKGHARSEGRQHNVDQGQRGSLPGLCKKALRREEGCLHSSSLTSQLSKPKGDHMELGRFEKPCDIPFQIFPTLPYAKVSDPFSFQVQKPNFDHGGCRGQCLMEKHFGTDLSIFSNILSLFLPHT